MSAEVTKLLEGRGKTQVKVSQLMVRVGGNIIVAYDLPFLVDVSFVYEAAIKATEDEPGCDEYVEALSIRLQQPMYLSDDKGGVTLSIDSRCELLELLTFAQIESIEECVTSAPESRLQYENPDNARPAVNERIKEMLGHNFEQPYEREPS